MLAHHLLRYHYYSLDGKSSIAMVEKILEGGSEEVDHEYIVEAFLAEIIYIRDTSYSCISKKRYDAGKLEY